MGVRIYNENQLELIRKAGRVLCETFTLLKNNIKDGVKTKELDKIAEDFILANDCTTPCKGYEGYPAATCISVNEELIHGIPGNRKLNNGDIVSIDIVVGFNGYFADATRTFFVGEPSETNRKLEEVAKMSFFEGIKFAKEGLFISDISKAIQQYVEKNNFSVIREFVGHGVGQKIHEAPEIPNFYSGNRGAKLSKGMVLAIEPMIASGKPDIKILRDGWTVVMADGKNSAHYENTIVITDEEPEIVTIV